MGMAGIALTAPHLIGRGGVSLGSAAAVLIMTFLMGFITALLRRSQERAEQWGTRAHLMRQEAHHRVANNLQALAGLLSWQASLGPEMESGKSFKDQMSRVESISLVHRMLSCSENEDLPIRDLIQKVILAAANTSGMPDIGLKVEGDNIKLNSDNATSMAMVINELALNSIEHGFNGRNSGNINVVISKGRRGKSVIEFHDNGVGLPNDFNLQKDKGTGLHIIENLITNDFDGTISLRSDCNGVRACINFKSRGTGKKSRMMKSFGKPKDTHRKI